MGQGSEPFEPELERLTDERGRTLYDLGLGSFDELVHARDPFPVGGVVEDAATTRAAQEPVVRSRFCELCRVQKRAVRNAERRRFEIEEASLEDVFVALVGERPA